MWGSMKNGWRRVLKLRGTGQTGSQQPAHNAFYFIIVLLAAVSLILYLC